MKTADLSKLSQLP